MLAGNYMTVTASQITGLPLASRGNHRTNQQIQWSLRTLNLANFSAAQLEQLHSLLSSNPTHSTSLMAQSGVHVSHANGLPDLGEVCIVDSSDFDHMTSCAHFFSTYSPSSGNHRVTLTDGSFSTVAGTGTIRLSPNLVLKDVLYVPKLACTLISVCKLTKDLDCVANFSDRTGVLQDLSSRARIGNARLVASLYCPKIDPQVNSQAYSAFGLPSSSINNNVMLLNFHLGDPNFMYMKHLFLKLFPNKNISFQYEICQLAKHTRFFLPPHPYKPSHSDICGPPHIRTVKHCWFIIFIDDHSRVSWIYLLKGKSDAEHTFKTSYNMVLTQFHVKINLLQSDNEAEYFNSILG
ncbi:putative RNA-directed DNA polymerase [Dioscorea sansibarensis]